MNFSNFGENRSSLIYVSTLDHLIGLVGNNKTHLRRVCAIRLKAHYRDTAFMGRLRQKHRQFGFNLRFDAAGKIVPTPETCGDVIRALLDHRLQSPFSTNIYDVEDAVPVH